MAFDIVSFLAGISAGGLTGVLAGVLYSFDRTAKIQESLIRLGKKIDSVDPAMTVPSGLPDSESRARMSELRAELDSIQEEIRSMYRKTTR